MINFFYFKFYSSLIVDSQRLFGGCLAFVFPSPITQNMWVPWLNGLFGDVFSFCFHHLILWFLVMSYGNWKHILSVFKLWKQNYDSIFVNTHTMRDPSTTTFASLSFFLFSFFFFLLHFSFFFICSLVHSLFLSFSFLFAFLILIRSFFFFFLPFFLYHLRPIKKKKKNQEIRLKGEREGASSTAETMAESPSPVLDQWAPICYADVGVMYGVWSWWDITIKPPPPSPLMMWWLWLSRIWVCLLLLGC